MTKAVLSAMIRPLVEPRLPDWVEPLWFTSKEQALEFAPQAEIGWFDLNEKEPMVEIATAATQLKWMNSIYAGLDFMPLDLLAERGVVVTNGVGINAITIAEYVVMLMLAHAKGYREVVRAQDRHEWLLDSPGKRELGPAVLRGDVKLLVDSRKQCEAFGEAFYRPEGLPTEELGEHKWAGAPPRATADTVIVCDLTGIATQDVAIACAVRDAVVSAEGEAK